MRHDRVRDFRRDERQITRVAENVDAPFQLSLDELVPAQVHGYDGTRATTYGYRAHCTCGHITPEYPGKRRALNEWRKHLARTPQGQALLAPLIRRGRHGHE